MAQNCSTNYVCTPIWYTSADRTENAGEDVIAYAAGPYAQDLNITCVVNTGTIEFQVKNSAGAWFTPSEASYTVRDSNLVRLPRANMPDIRIVANADAEFYIEGSLR